MVEKLLEHELWLEFLEYKTSKKLILPDEERFFKDYIEEKRYLPLAEKVVCGEFCFSVPEKKEINKTGTNKKRVIYCFNEDENVLLKMLAYLLYRYDDVLEDNCYSFRRNMSSRDAFVKMSQVNGISQMHGFKADISNYFNSIDCTLLMPILRNVITDDDRLLELFERLLTDNRALWQGELIEEKRGVMAGTPTSPFLANIYLNEMDKYFAARNVCYARYSDDILIFAEKEELDRHIEAFRGFLNKFGLTSNPSKEEYFSPGDKWNFLGFQYDNGIVDISTVAARKLTDKIRRAARAVRRWMLRKGVSPEIALRVFAGKFNRKFFSFESGRELCWCRWYFSVINTDRTLRFIDGYMQDWMRYIVTGRHNKANYAKVPYSMLKENGYRPLVSAYYDREKMKI